MYSELLLSGKYGAGIWGIGRIGLSTMVRLVSKGIQCLGYDTDPAKVLDVNNGTVFGYFALAELAVTAGNTKLCATCDASEVTRRPLILHVVAVPTEKEGAPYWDALRETIASIADGLTNYESRDRGHPILILVESTLAPGVTRDHIIPEITRRNLQIGRDVLIGVSPRRDWLTSASPSFHEIDRVYAGVDEQSANATEEILRFMSCNHLHRASSVGVAELVKAVENTYRFVEIALANEIAAAFPADDVREVLMLAATKWNMQLFTPSFGIGGYCVPLACKYLLESAERRQALRIVESGLISELVGRKRIAAIVLEHGCSNIGILGLSYSSRIKSATLSPAVSIANELLICGATVRVNDPKYTDDEIKMITGLSSFCLPDDLNVFDALLVNTDDPLYSTDDVRNAILRHSHRMVILDSHGAWVDWSWPEGAAYYVVGSAGWLGGHRLQVAAE